MNVREWVNKVGLREYLLERGIEYIVKDGEITFNNETLAIQLANDYDQVPIIRAELKEQLVETSQKFVDEAILKLYPKFEVDTWQNQLRDANAYIADTSSVPLTLETLSTQRGITALELANRIIAKSLTFEIFSSRQAGERQRLEDLLDNAETVEELNAVPKFAGV